MILPYYMHTLPSVDWQQNVNKCVISSTARLFFCAPLKLCCQCAWLFSIRQGKASPLLRLRSLSGRGGGVDVSMDGAQ